MQSICQSFCSHSILYICMSFHHLWCRYLYIPNVTLLFLKILMLHCCSLYDIPMLQNKREQKIRSNISLQIFFGVYNDFQNICQYISNLLCLIQVASCRWQLISHFFHTLYVCPFYMWCRYLYIGNVSFYFSGVAAAMLLFAWYSWN